MPFAFHPNGRMLLTGDPGKELRLWSVPDGRPLGQPIPQSSSLGMTLAFSPTARPSLSMVPRSIPGRQTRSAQASGTPGVDVITRMKNQIGRQDRGLTTRVPATGITRNPFDSVASPLPGFRSPGGRTGILDFEAPSSPNVVETRISTPRKNNIISLWPLPSTYPDTVAGLTLGASPGRGRTRRRRARGLSTPRPGSAVAISAGVRNHDDTRSCPLPAAPRGGDPNDPRSGRQSRSKLLRCRQPRPFSPVSDTSEPVRLFVQ